MLPITILQMKNREKKENICEELYYGFLTMDLIYLDHNCFQRGVDDPRQIRIQMEALACQEVFLRAEQDMVRLVWSFMHQDEAILCPFPERKYEVLRLNILCKVRIGPDEEIHRLALSFQKKRRCH